MEYRVTWRIDIDADSPRDAAEQALAVQRRVDGIATVFEVTARKPNALTETVDLIDAPKEES